MKHSPQIPRQSCGRNLRLAAALLGANVLCLPAAGQASPAGIQTPSSGNDQAVASQTKATLTLTLRDALDRAKTNEPQFRAAINDFKVAQEDTVQARAALLPVITENSQYVHTQGTGASITGVSNPRFIASNATNEYLSQANAHEMIGPAELLQLRRARAASALAKAKAELATRGLVVTVTSAYYGLIAAERKYATAQEASREAQAFLDISRKLENGGEVAKSDTLKAQLQANDRQRDLFENQLAMEASRTGLAVLLFPDLNQNFTVVDDLQPPQAIPSEDEIREIAMRNNPQLQGADAALRVANQDVLIARSGHLPSLMLDYFYGIDAPHAALYTNGISNLGYSFVATLNIPVWSWGATQSKVKQAEYRRDQAKLELTFAQRQLLANILTFYHEAVLSASQLQLLADSSQLAEQSLHLTTLRYQSGEATVLEVVDAQNTLSLARNAYNDGQVRHKIAVAKLQTLTGTF